MSMKNIHIVLLLFSLATGAYAQSSQSQSDRQGGMGLGDQGNQGGQGGMLLRLSDVPI